VKEDEIKSVIKANIDKIVWVAYVDGETEKLYVHTVDDEGFVCDIAAEVTEPPAFAHWVRFRNIREARPARNAPEEKRPK